MTTLDAVALAAMRERARRTERRLIEAGLDHAITDDILALLARVAELEREIAHGRQLEAMFPEAGPE